MSEDNFIANWGEKIDWKKRVKAICKPCWELKYCPYGPLVETFPIQEENDDKSCRIFGHDCPVFYVAEPFTETKELRNVSRSIPRSIQFKVLKRDNNVCRECKKPVLEDDIHFDHIIPWSKGGPTEEHNIRLLCADCNRKKGNRFEDEFLIKQFSDHMIEPEDIDYIDIIKMTVAFGNKYFITTDSMPNAQDYANEFAEGEVSLFEEQAATLFNDFVKFFFSSKPTELSKKEFKFLKTRWGFEDNEIYFLQELSDDFNYEIHEAVLLDKMLLSRLGIRIKDRKSDLKKWEKY